MTTDLVWSRITLPALAGAATMAATGALVGAVAGRAFQLITAHPLLGSLRWLAGPHFNGIEYGACEGSSIGFLIGAIGFPVASLFVQSRQVAPGLPTPLKALVKSSAVGAVLGAALCALAGTFAGVLFTWILDALRIESRTVIWPLSPLFSPSKFASPRARSVVASGASSWASWRDVSMA